MPWKIHDKEYANVAVLPDFDRYTYMCAKFGDSRRASELCNADGWVLASDDEGREGVPVWPHARFAEACAAGSWQGCVPAVIALNDWMNKWLPGMERDNRYVAAFVLPGASNRSIKVEPAKHREHLLAGVGIDAKTARLKRE